MRVARLLLVILSAVAGLCVNMADTCAGDPEVKRLAEIIDLHARDPFEQRERSKAIRDLGRLGGRAATQALAEVFEDPFVHLQDHAVSAWIAMVRGKRADESLAWFETRGASHKSPAVRRGVAIALGFAPAARGLGIVAARLQRERDPEVLVALLGAAQRAGLPPGSAGLGSGLGHKDGRVALATVDALVRWDAADSIEGETAEKLLRHRHPLAQAAGVHLLFARGEFASAADTLDRIGTDVVPRIALAEALRRESNTLPWDPDGRALFAALLDDASWRVRAAAIQTALHRQRADTVPMLIERLPIEKGRLRLDLVHTLERMSGKTLGMDPDLWRAWWKAVGEDFEPLRPSTGGARLAEAPDESRTEAASFFRLPVLGNRIAFLIDCSGSMRDPATEGDEGGPTKMDVARVELARTLESLDRGVQFDVFLYRYPSKFPPKPVMTRALGKFEECTPRRARKAIQWMERQPAKGWGAFYDALSALLAKDVDTIYFLSDGRPSRGLYDRDFRLVAELEKRNRFRRVVVHTVLTGRAEADREFLENLAASTGGRFADALGGRTPR